jgi:hypothetical protein
MRKNAKRPKTDLDNYTVESRWQWFRDNRIRITDDVLHPKDLEQIRTIFYIGFGEAIDLMMMVGDSEASEDECGEFLSRIEQEVRQFHLAHSPAVGGRQ